MSETKAGRTRDRLDALAVANLVFLGTMAVHSADHIRQGTGRLTPEVFWGGLLLGVLALGTLPLTLRRDPRGPLAAAVIGLWTALAVSASHLAPHWSAFSDPYPELSVDAVSWAAMISEVLAALVFGLTGLRELHRQATRRRSRAATGGVGNRAVRA
jgi:hypothetical protein